MKILVLCLILLSSVWGARIVESYWLEGQVFSRYLEERDIPLGLLQRIDEEDKKFLLEIQSGEKFYELFDEAGRLLQALIPIGEEMQIQVVREADSGIYSFDIVPIVFADHEHQAVIPIQSNPHSDIMQATNNIRLADKIDRFFKHTVDCRKLQKNDTMAIVYTQKERLGKPLGSPKVKIAMMETGAKKQFIYADKSGIPCKSSTKKVTYDS
ncbi:MAG TPA: M23 family peptidase, partial [Epsilonproteobacteria bacterium]|nr:M23 family peptidase [Campylobacterota bacterium]